MDKQLLKRTLADLRSTLFPRRTKRSERGRLAADLRSILFPRKTAKPERRSPLADLRSILSPGPDINQLDRLARRRIVRDAIFSGPSDPKDVESSRMKKKARRRLMRMILGARQHAFRGDDRPYLEGKKAIPDEPWAKPNGPEPNRRAELIQILAERRPRNLFSLVRSYIDDQSSLVRYQALHAAAVSGDRAALPLIRKAQADPTPMVQNEAPTLIRIFFVANPDLIDTGWGWYLLTGAICGVVGLLGYVLFLKGLYTKDHSLVVSYALISVAGVGGIHEMTKKFSLLLQWATHLVGGVVLGLLFSRMFFLFYPGYSLVLYPFLIYPMFMASIAQIGILFAASKVILRQAVPLVRILLPAGIAGFGGLLAVVAAKAPFGPHNFLYCFLNALGLCLISERYALMPFTFVRYSRFGE